MEKQLNAIITLLRLIKSDLCKLLGLPTINVSADNCGVLEQTTVQQIVQTIPHPEYTQKVELCTSPIKVEVVNFPDQISSDIEWLCDEVSNTWIKVIHTFVNGVEQSETPITTNISCSDTPPADVEFQYICNSTTGFYNRVERIYNTDGTLNIETVTQTTIPCSINYQRRDICINTVDNEIWNVIEQTGSDGSLTYLDPDTSPVTDVTSMYLSIRHAGKCNCCEDNLPPIIIIQLVPQQMGNKNDDTLFGNSITAPIDGSVEFSYGYSADGINFTQTAWAVWDGTQIMSAYPAATLSNGDYVEFCLRYLGDALSEVCDIKRIPNVVVTEDTKNGYVKTLTNNATDGLNPLFVRTDLTETLNITIDGILTTYYINYTDNVLSIFDNTSTPTTLPSGVSIVRLTANEFQLIATTAFLSSGGSVTIEEVGVHGYNVYSDGVQTTQALGAYAVYSVTNIQYDNFVDLDNDVQSKGYGCQAGVLVYPFVYIDRDGNNAVAHSAQDIIDNYAALSTPLTVTVNGCQVVLPIGVAGQDIEMVCVGCAAWDEGYQFYWLSGNLHIDTTTILKLDDCANVNPILPITAYESFYGLLYDVTAGNYHNILDGSMIDGWQYNKAANTWTLIYGSLPMPSLPITNNISLPIDPNHVYEERRYAKLGCYRESVTLAVPIPFETAQQLTYVASVLGQVGCNDKFTIGADVKWQVKVYKNGVVEYSSALSPVLTSQAQALTWLNANNGGFWSGVINSGKIDYTFPSGTLPDEYYMTIMETTNGIPPLCLVFPIAPSMGYGFTNKGTTFGAPCDNADAINVTDDTWANRMAWYWVC